MRESLTYLHHGAFSGSAPSLLDALRAATGGEVTAIDTMPMTRHPALLLSRARGTLEARRAGRVPWTKTAAWSAGLQRHLTRTGVLDTSRPALIVQSLPAFSLTGLRYGVYTDRVGREGASVGGVHASMFSPGWLRRETAFLRGAHRVFVMGPSTRTVLIEEYRCEPDRVVVVGAGPNTTLHRSIRRTECRRMLFVGTQWALKGGPTLLAAFADLRRDRPDPELMLVGSEPGGPLPPGVVAKGRIGHAEMDAAYSAADLVVIPTHVEAFGISLVEALIKGLPCVCSTVGNQPWIVGDAGIAVTPGDAAGLADALRRIVEDYPAFQARAAARGAVLRTTMSWPAVARAIVDGLCEAPTRTPQRTSGPGESDESDH